MNPYHKQKKSLDAAKARFRSLNGTQPPKKPFRPYAIEKPSSVSILRARVAMVRGWPEKELNRLVHSREIQKPLKLENINSTSRNRALHTVLATAGIEPLRKETVKAMDDLKYGRIVSRTVRHEPYLTMLEVAGIVEIRKFKNGRREAVILDKERLEESIKHGKIIW